MPSKNLIHMFTPVLDLSRRRVRSCVRRRLRHIVHDPGEPSHLLPRHIEEVLRGDRLAGLRQAYLSQSVGHSQAVRARPASRRHGCRRQWNDRRRSRRASPHGKWHCVRKVIYWWLWLALLVVDLLVAVSRFAQCQGASYVVVTHTVTFFSRRVALTSVGVCILLVVQQRIAESWHSYRLLSGDLFYVARISQYYTALVIFCISAKRYRTMCLYV